MTFTVVFERGGGRRTRAMRINAMSDPAIERARKRAERETGEALPVDERTAYPSFAVYEDGEEVAGG